MPAALSLLVTMLLTGIAWIMTDPTAAFDSVSQHRTVMAFPTAVPASKVSSQKRRRSARQW
jgi:hypothetical protein